MRSSHQSEEAVSFAIFAAAMADTSLEVLSWQAVDGKGYFTADVKLRLPTGERMEPDLILADPEVVWLIEVKALHSETTSDEKKLARIPDELGEEQTLKLLSLHSGLDVTSRTLRLAVAYDVDDVMDLRGCSPAVAHIEWQSASVIAEEQGLSSLLRSL